MKLYCPQCKTEVPIVIIFISEKVFNTETKDLEYHDLDFQGVECADCHWAFDELLIPDNKQQEYTDLYNKGWTS